MSVGPGSKSIMFGPHMTHHNGSRAVNLYPCTMLGTGPLVHQGSCLGVTVYCEWIGGWAHLNSYDLQRETWENMGTNYLAKKPPIVATKPRG